MSESDPAKKRPPDCQIRRMTMPESDPHRPAKKSPAGLPNPADVSVEPSVFKISYQF